MRWKKDKKKIDFSMNAELFEQENAKLACHKTSPSTDVAWIYDVGKVPVVPLPQNERNYFESIGSFVIFEKKN